MGEKTTLHYKRILINKDRRNVNTTNSPLGKYHNIKLLQARSTHDAKSKEQKSEEQEDIYQYKGKNRSFTLQKLGDTLSK